MTGSPRPSSTRSRRSSKTALEHPVDFKSALQERLARRGAIVSYEVVGEQGPPHDRTFTIAAVLGGERDRSRRGRSKKDAEQLAAQAALENTPTSRRER